MKVPTDLAILEEIYKDYYSSYSSFQKGGSDRESKIYVPIVCGDIARKLNVDADIVFGRLYYHLEQKYGYKQSDGVNVHFFALRIGENDVHCVNFPLMASVLAGLQHERDKYKMTTALSVVALAVSVISILISMAG